MISVFDRFENIVEKGENVGYQHFLLFSHYFPKPSSLQLLSRDCVVKGYRLKHRIGRKRFNQWFPAKGSWHSAGCLAVQIKSCSEFMYQNIKNRYRGVEFFAKPQNFTLDQIENNCRRPCKNIFK